MILKALGTKNLQTKYKIQVKFCQEKDQSLEDQSRPNIPYIDAFFKKAPKPLV